MNKFAILALAGLCLSIACAGSSKDPPTPVAAASGSVAQAPPVVKKPVKDGASESNRTLCCSQCTTAASKDPTGQDISLVPCADYTGYVVNGQQLLSEVCSRWFAEHPLMVQDCR